MCVFLVCLLVVLVGGQGWKSCKSRENKLNCGLDSQFLTPTRPSDIYILKGNHYTQNI